MNVALRRQRLVERPFEPRQREQQKPRRESGRQPHAIGERKQPAAWRKPRHEACALVSITRPSPARVSERQPASRFIVP